MKIKKLPQLQSHGGGRPHAAAPVFEVSETVMDAQSCLMDLRAAFNTLMDQAQQKLREAQQAMMEISSVANGPKVRVA